MRKVLFRFTCVAQERRCVSSGIPLSFREWREQRTREQKKQRGIEDQVGGFVRKNGQRRSFALFRPTFILHAVVSLTQSLPILSFPINVSDKLLLKSPLSLSVELYQKKSTILPKTSERIAPYQAAAIVVLFKG